MIVVKKMGVHQICCRNNMVCPKDHLKNWKTGHHYWIWMQCLYVQEYCRLIPEMQLSLPNIVLISGMDLLIKLIKLVMFFTDNLSLSDHICTRWAVTRSHAEFHVMWTEKLEIFKLLVCSIFLPAVMDWKRKLFPKNVGVTNHLRSSLAPTMQAMLMQGPPACG